MAKKNADPDRRRKIEEARRKQKAAERRRTVLAVGGAGIVAIALIIGALFWDTGGGSNGDDPEPAAAELIKLGATKDLAECSPVENADPIPEGSKHKNGTLEWPENPPDGGEHRGTTLRNLKNFYSRDDNPAPEQAVHNLEHGVIVVWYDKQVSDAEVEILRQVAASVPDKRTMVVPWLRDDFKDDKHVVLTAWGHRQRCGKVSGQVVNDFLTEYKDAKGDAPEKGAQV